MSDRHAVIGYPVAHSKSPWIHAEFARATREAPFLVRPQTRPVLAKLRGS